MTAQSFTHDGYTFKWVESTSLPGTWIAWVELEGIIHLSTAHKDRLALYYLRLKLESLGFEDAADAMLEIP